MMEEHNIASDGKPPERLSTLVELLAAIKRRPAMCLSKNYISCLKAYLSGWSLLAHQHDIAIEDEWMWAFQDWIAAKYGITSDHGWAEIILFHSQDESTALKDFFILFEEWQAAHEFKS
ncbi:hypothetical protein [Hymenobacter terrenus]|uniref:hypothetical protein n=1 Tax=Hymenobacter terrenus TaxID=1629124 RepID=UPI000697CFA3|nr:hypothetical protein [Hymenobacter terrenus]